jgi:hypothetical protein
MNLKVCGSGVCQLSDFIFCLARASIFVCFSTSASLNVLMNSSVAFLLLKGILVFTKYCVMEPTMAGDPEED